MEEQFDSKAEDEDERIDSKMTIEAPVGEFLPAAGAEDDTASPGSGSSEPVLAALGENSGIVDGVVSADVKSGGNGAVTAPVEPEPYGAEEGKEAVSEEAAFTDPLAAATNSAERGADVFSEEATAPSTRRAAKPSNGNGADGGVEPELDGFGSLDIEEIEDFIFAGRAKG